MKCLSDGASGTHRDLVQRFSGLSHSFLVGNLALQLMQHV